jgi:hypothetical protein
MVMLRRYLRRFLLWAIMPFDPPARDAYPYWADKQRVLDDEGQLFEYQADQNLLRRLADVFVSARRRVDFSAPLPSLNAPPPPRPRVVPIKPTLRQFLPLRQDVMVIERKAATSLDPDEAQRLRDLRRNHVALFNENPALWVEASNMAMEMRQRIAHEQQQTKMLQKIGYG